MEACPKHKCISTVGVRYDLYGKTPSKVKVTDFFGSVRHINFLDSTAFQEDPEMTDNEYIADKANNHNKKIEFQMAYIDQFEVFSV